MTIFSKRTSRNFETAKTQKGVSLTPLSFREKDFLDFFENAKQAGSVIAWAGEWETLRNLKSAPYVLLGLSKQYSYTPVIIVSAETKDKAGYIAALSDLATSYKPKYLGLGNEVNYTFRNNPSEVDAFANIFSESYDIVKAKSPNTKIFTVFQYETPGNALNLTSKFPKADLIAFTTYPELKLYKTPKDIPSDYYTKIKSKLNKPVAFTEIGWQGNNEALQSDFINSFFELTKDIKPEFIIWPFLYDQKTEKFFSNMGLFDSSGNQRAAWDVWKKI